MADVIKLYVACSPNGEDAESMMVLEHSLKRNTTIPCDITWMKTSANPASPWGGWVTHRWATPFSGYRWAIPYVETEAEQAIYSDSDVIFLSDLKRLWDQPFAPGKVVLAKGEAASWRYCVSKWNIPAARAFLGGYYPTLEKLKADSMQHESLAQIFAGNKKIVQPFAGNWNCLDGEGRPVSEIDGLHYTRMGTQFHLSRARPRLAAAGHKHWFDGQVTPHPRQDLQRLFDAYYNEAIASGMAVENYIPDEEDRIDIVKASVSGRGGTITINK